MKTALLTILLTLFSQTCFALKKSFYVLHNLKDTKTITTIKNNSKSIDIIISQAYHIDKKGIVSGYIAQDVLDFSQKNKKPLMAMVTNASFDPNIAHQFLSDTKAQANAITSLLETCQKYHLYGIQFDFEMLKPEDKNALTTFYQTAAKTLHENHFVVSFAVMPTLSNGPFATKYQEKFYKNSQAFDLKALSHSADFITVMAYDQHTGKMTPGPIAGLPWVEQIIKYSLNYIPREKISLGIPVYSGFWYTGMTASKSFSIKFDAISYELAEKILTKNNAKIIWDSNSKVNYSAFNRNWLNEYIFLENAKSFKAKYDLAKKYHLGGISVFRIGTEDPSIWKILK